MRSCASVCSRISNRRPRVNWITVARFSFPHEAEIARSALEAEGIEAFVPDSQTASLYSAVTWGQGGVRLQVRPADEARARAQLDAFFAQVADDEPADGDASP